MDIHARGNQAVVVQTPVDAYRIPHGAAFGAVGRLVAGSGRLLFSAASVLRFVRDRAGVVAWLCVSRVRCWFNHCNFEAQSRLAAAAFMAVGAYMALNLRCYRCCQLVEPVGHQLSVCVRDAHHGISENIGIGG